MRRRSLLSNHIDPSKLRLKGKFTNSSTENDWHYTQNNRPIKIPVDPTTKEFDIELTCYGSLEGMFESNKALERIYEFPDTANCTSLAHAFTNCTSLISANIFLNNESSIDLSNIFHGCLRLTDVQLTSSHKIIASNTTCMFYGCSQITDINLSKLNIQIGKDMSYMFALCYELSDIDLSSFDTKAVASMEYVFDNCRALNSVNLSSFDTTSVQSMCSMFANCQCLINLDLSNFKADSLQNIAYMFANCSTLKSLDLSTFSPTSNLYNLMSIFNNATSLTNIRTTQTFKNCLSRTTLPSNMTDGGTCVWDIIG